MNLLKDKITGMPRGVAFVRCPTPFLHLKLFFMGFLTDLTNEKKQLRRLIILTVKFLMAASTPLA